jgi:hypothetical protein
MKAFIVSLALAAAGLGSASILNYPAVIDARQFHLCSHGRYCSSPEPDGCTGKCEYWQNCGPNCGCRVIQNCTP